MRRGIHHHLSSYQPIYAPPPFLHHVRYNQPTMTSSPQSTWFEYFDFKYVPCFISLCIQYFSKVNMIADDWFKSLPPKTGLNLKGKFASKPWLKRVESDFIAAGAIWSSDRKRLLLPLPQTRPCQICKTKLVSFMAFFASRPQRAIFPTDPNVPAVVWLAWKELYRSTS